MNAPYLYKPCASATRTGNVTERVSGGNAPPAPPEPTHVPPHTTVTRTRYAPPGSPADDRVNVYEQSVR
ncbi:hypothetical protein [Thermomonospora cellulosilytica]|uniref:Uncharacterized protein n=1 Tax=Thermomonospora cellulosilytica TaxID=1411118 RepID=A0A7W3MW85_9ACTN|nr:hypothetical protein [Thermomonospora cellulosilytica]MBA9003054.1 hypothetical protein [Thermomonospora cellulosilytica]